MTPPDPGPSCPDDVAAVLAAGHGTVGRAWSAVAPSSAAAPETRLAYADDESVRATTQLVECRPDGFGMLLRLRHQLQRMGWVVGRPPTDPRQLVAWGHEGQLFATYSETTSSVLVELTSEPVRVGAEQTRRLVRSFDRPSTGPVWTTGPAPAG